MNNDKIGLIIQVNVEKFINARNFYTNYLDR